MLQTHGSRTGSIETQKLGSSKRTQPLTNKSVTSKRESVAGYGNEEAMTPNYTNDVRSSNQSGGVIKS